MAIHFLCSCEWQYSCDDDKVICSFQCRSCASTDCVMRGCIANHFLCSCVCEMDHEYVIKYFLLFTFRKLYVSRIRRKIRAGKSQAPLFSKNALLYSRHFKLRNIGTSRNHLLSIFYNFCYDTTKLVQAENCVKMTSMYHVDHGHWCPSRDAWQKVAIFRQAAFMNGCHGIWFRIIDFSPSFDVSLYWSSRPRPDEFFHWIRFRLELRFQRWPPLFWFQDYQFMADCFSSAAFGCFSFIFFMMSVVGLPTFCFAILSGSP